MFSIINRETAIAASLALLLTPVAANYPQELKDTKLRQCDSSIKFADITDMGRSGAMMRRNLPTTTSMPTPITRDGRRTSTVTYSPKRSTAASIAWDPMLPAPSASVAVSTISYHNRISITDLVSHSRGFQCS
jgi:hypothetical protein